MPTLIEGVEDAFGLLGRGGAVNCPPADGWFEAWDSAACERLRRASARWA